MKESVYTAYEDLPLFLNAETVVHAYMKIIGNRRQCHGIGLTGIRFPLRYRLRRYIEGCGKLFLSDSCCLSQIGNVFGYVYAVHMNPPSLFPCAHQIVLKLYHIFKTNQQRKTAGLKPLVEWKTYFRLWVSKDATKLVFLNTENLPMWRRNQIVSKKTAESGAENLIFG